MSNKVLLGRFLSTTMLTGIAAAAATPVFAQTDTSEGDEILVTGSRIARDALDSPSPVTAVSAADLQVANTVNTEDFLNDLPQLVPAFDSSSNNPGNGTATLNLRGLGTVRTLILLDGKRMVPSGVGGVVDINNVPAALLDRVDVVTGGASAVYGSDAVAGVVNFILKDDFEGVELSSSYQTTGKSDGQTLNLSGIIGGNFADGKGNAVLSIGYTNRKPLFQGDRAFSSLTLQEDYNTTTGFRFGGSSNTEGGRILSPAFTTIGNPPGCAGTCSGSTFDPVTGEYRGWQDPADRYNYAPTNYLQLPQERYNIAGFAQYEIADGIEIYGRGLFTHVLVEAQLAPTPVGLTGSSGYATVEEDNPFLYGPGATPAAAAFGAALLACGTCNFGDTNSNGINERGFILLRRYSEFGTRNTPRTTDTFLLGGGIRGQVWDGWKWDVYAQFARTDVTQVQTGGISFGNFATNGGSCATTSAASCPSNTLRGAIFAGTANVFGPATLGTVSAASVAALSRTAIVTSNNETAQILATLGGDTGWQLPWASNGVYASFGLEYREESALQQPDSVTGADIAGPNQTVFTQGRYDTKEVFGEVNIPVIEDRSFFKSFDVAGGFRYSDYSTVGGVKSWFVGGKWQPVDDVRFRVQYQAATRAPNISELFLAPGNGFPGVIDPCAGGINNVTGGWQALSAAQQAIVGPRCVADGVPLASIGTNIQPNAQVQLRFSGNGATLEAEKARTLTIGAVFEPTFLDNFTATVDYYRINIGNAIGAPTGQSIIDECFLFNITSACDQTQRTAGGNLSLGQLTNPVLVRNAALIGQRGIDLTMNYRFDLPGDFGSFAWQLQGTRTLSSTFQGAPGSSVFDCAGLYGGVCGEPTPKYKFTTVGTLTHGALTAALRYSWLSGVDDSYTVRYDAYANRRFVAGIGSYGNLDLTLGYDVNDIVSLSFGALNILNPDVPVLGDCCNEQANTYPGTYETLGRQFFAGARVKF